MDGAVTHRIAKPLFGLAGVLLCLAGTAHAGQADLSMLSDFGQPDIPESVLGLPAAAGNTAGISQMGFRNEVSIEQTNGVRNNAEVWQTGSNLSANVHQSGTDNALRLSQSTDHQTAVLNQAGIGNQMAIWQTGAYADLSGAQVGAGNQLVLQQAGSSQFGFSQIGNANQILVDLPSGMSLRVDQTGDNARFSFHPAN